MPSFSHDRHIAPPRSEANLVGAADLMDAMLAAYALMAHADGEVAPAERRRMFAILRESPVLSAFSHDEIAAEIAEHEANYRLDPEVAEQIAREKLALVVGQDRAARQVIAACRALIPADGVAHPSEYRALAEIRDMLGCAAWESAATQRQDGLGQTS